MAETRTRNIGSDSLALRIPLREFFAPIGGPICVATAAAAISATISFISSPTTRAAALVPLFTGSALFSILYLVLGLRLKYIPSFMLALGAYRQRFHVRGGGLHRLREQPSPQCQAVRQKMIPTRDSSRSTESPAATDAVTRHQRDKIEFLDYNALKTRDE